MRLAITALVGLALGAPVAAAAAQASGSETLNIVIVASTNAGTRTVIASPVLARGVFNGTGHLVEVENRPGDPGNVLRDDLVFRAGTMHLRSEVLGLSATVDPRSCVATVRIDQAGTIEGGTGRFTTATGSFAGTLTGIGVVPRNPDGSCNQEASPPSEVDYIVERGTLSV